MGRPKRAVQNKTSSGGSCGFPDILVGALLSEFPWGMILLVLGGVFLLLYWLGKKVWEHAPGWKASLAEPAGQRKVLLVVGVILGLGLLALDFVPVHTLSLDTVRAALCIAGIGAALLVRRSLYCE